MFLVLSEITDLNSAQLLDVIKIKRCPSVEKPSISERSSCSYRSLNCLYLQLLLIHLSVCAYLRFFLHSFSTSEAPRESRKRGPICPLPAYKKHLPDQGDLKRNPPLFIIPIKKNYTWPGPSVSVGCEHLWAV